jgi:hypothetical protein
VVARIVAVAITVAATTIIEEIDFQIPITRTTRTITITIIEVDLIHLKMISTTIVIIDVAVAAVDLMIRLHQGLEIIIIIIIIIIATIVIAIMIHLRLEETIIVIETIKAVEAEVVLEVKPCARISCKDVADTVIDVTICMSAATTTIITTTIIVVAIRDRIVAAFKRIAARIEVKGDSNNSSKGRRRPIRFATI